MMKSDLLFRANSPAKLLEEIAKLEVVVPPRYEGRKKWHVEQWAIHRLLQVLPISGYPVTLIRSERPDFLLCVAGITTGIEHTEAVSKVEAKIDFEQGRLGETPARMVDARTPHDPQITKAQAQSYVSRGAPFVGDEYKQNWLLAISSFIATKAQKFKDYKLCDRRAILVYDNWLLPGLETRECAPLLASWLNDAAIFSLVDEVFVVRHDAVIAASQACTDILITQDLRQFSSR